MVATIVHTDSFDHWNAGTTQAKYELFGGNPGCNTTAPRSGAQAMAIGGNGTWAGRTGLPNTATYVVGVAIRPSATDITTGYGVSVPIIGFYDAGTNQIGVGIGAGGTLYAGRGLANVLGATSVGVMTQDTYKYIEVALTIDNSVGTVQIWVDGVSVLNLTSIDTQNTANAQINEIRLGRIGNGPGGTTYFDDYYIRADSLTRLGDCRVQAIHPDGNGTTSNLVGSDSNSTDNYLLVDEAVPPSTTDYVESSTVNDKDTYAYGALTPTSGTIHAVNILPFAAKTDAGTRSIRGVARLSGIEEDGSADLSLSTTARYYHDIHETKPGGGAWTISDVNSAEFGVKVTA